MLSKTADLFLPGITIKLGPASARRQVGVLPEGCGKTFAFVLPAFGQFDNRIQEHDMLSNVRRPNVVIIPIDR